MSFNTIITHLRKKENLEVFGEGSKLILKCSGTHHAINFVSEDALIIFCRRHSFEVRP